MSVYFAQRQNLIKIGWSRNVPNRVCALQAKLIGAVPGDKATEAELHKRFAHLQVRGEWFRDDDELLSYIQSEAQNHMPDYKNVQTAIRLPEALLDRIDELAKRMSRPGMTPVTRAEVLRLAAFRGVDQLEAEGVQE